MVSANKLLTQSEWKNLLDSFSNLTKIKEYLRIDYASWKTLIKPVSSNIAITLELGALGDPIILIAIGAHNPLTFYPTDNSFGSFLFEQLFNEEERYKVLNQCNCNCNSDENKIASWYNPNTSTTCTIDTDTIKVCSVSNDSWTNTATTSIGNSILNVINTYPTFDDVNKMIDDKVKKGNEKMKGFNFDFGPCINEQVHMSMYGIAVKNSAGIWVSYDPKSEEIKDVDIFNFDGAKYMYKMPVAVKDVRPGDVIIHNRKPMFVIDGPSEESKNFVCVDVMAGEEKIVIPTLSPFGFNFITKIVNLFDSMMAPNANNPFGNMWMFAFMSDDKNFDIKDMVMLSMMSGNDFGSMNPMMLMLMADNKGDKSDWLMPLMFMMQAQSK